MRAAEAAQLFHIVFALKPESISGAHEAAKVKERKRLNAKAAFPLSLIGTPKSELAKRMGLS